LPVARRVTAKRFFGRPVPGMTRAAELNRMAAAMTTSERDYEYGQTHRLHESLDFHDDAPA
jgi:hypothetical protein